MPVTATKEYIRRPTLTRNELLIDEKENETRYVPSSLVPSEIVGTIYRNKLKLEFKYISPESSGKKLFPLKDVEIELGKFTEKILAISVSFEPTYENLLDSFDVAAKAIRKARVGLPRASAQKSYDLISSFLAQAKEDFRTEKKRSELNSLFVTAA